MMWGRGLTTEERVRHAEDLFREGLQAVRAEAAIRKHVRRVKDQLRIGTSTYTIGAGHRVLVVGGGKAAAGMAAALEKILDGRLESGLVAVKDGHLAPTEQVEIVEAGHPVPDVRSADAAERVLEIARSAREGDLLIVLLTGGASALLAVPAEGLTLEDKRVVTDGLLRGGATVGELNTVRKHLSRIKGGRLAGAAAPARVVALVLSDVVGDRIDVIASGPTAADPSTFQDALDVLEKYDPENLFPTGVRAHLRAGAAGVYPETLKPGDPHLGEVLNLIVGRNRDALDAMRVASDRLGYHTFIISSEFEGEAREVSAARGRLAREVLDHGRPVKAPACLLAGGETTVRVRGKGKGGRNTESALAFALAIDGLQGVVGLFAGTDGTDGPTDAAGALVDGATIARARKMGVDGQAFLDENDSYNFFSKVGGLFVTGPTMTNVMDLQIVLIT
jgi:hydroxypyruvate reductase